MICLQRDGGEPHCHHIFQLHVPHSTAHTMGHINPQEASRHTAGADGFVPGPARAWWACVGGSTMGGIPPPWFLYIGVLLQKVQLWHICSSDKPSPSAASPEEKEHHERSPVTSPTASAVGMLKQHLDFLKKCGWWGGRKGLALFMLTHVSQLPRQRSFLHQPNGDIHSPREDTTAHLFHKWTLT